MQPKENFIIIGHDGIMFIEPVEPLAKKNLPATDVKSSDIMKKTFLIKDENSNERKY